MAQNGASGALYDQVKAWIIHGYNGGAWTGTGIDSSTAASVASDSGNSHKTALGYGDASSLGFSSFDTVDDLNSTAIIIKYTYYGDADLNGAVNWVDFNIHSIYAGNGTEWWQADFDYDGDVDFADYLALQANYGQTGL